MKPRLFHALLFVPFLLLAGCSSSSKPHKTAAQSSHSTIDGGSDDLIPVIAALHDQMHTWEGTPYEWGGTELRPGDLVFFRIKGGMHVGFYDTDRNFLHASTSQGVMRSSLDNPYWQSVFYQARRLPKEYNAQITMNNDNLHLAKNR